VASHGGKPGTISAVQEDGFVVEATDGAILVQRLRFGKGPKEAAMEWYNREGLTIGTTFGS
jgi:methionyl-tRNA formyltransferase